MLIDEQAREIPADAALHLMVGLVAKHRAGQGRIVHPGERVARRGTDRGARTASTSSARASPRPA